MHGYALDNLEAYLHAGMKGRPYIEIDSICTYYTLFFKHWM